MGTNQPLAFNEERQLHVDIMRAIVRDFHDGIRTYSIQTLIEQKINALGHRAAARDFYDLSFLTRQYGEHFSASSIQKLGELTVDIDTVEQRLMKIIFQVTEFVKQHP